MEAAKSSIVLGVTGGIAAYKSAELVRLLTERGYRLQVVMTAAAQRFVQPLTFAALTGQKVITELFSTSEGESTLQSAIEHIGVVQQADLLLVAPATADIVAKFAQGIADDFLATAHLAYRGPMVVAPAMNTNMWNHPATQKNVAMLRDRGVVIVEPDSGSLACGMVGPGRLAELDRIVAAVEEALCGLPPAPADLRSDVVLITAGPTREPIDPVRFLSNRSSGRMGFALAAEAKARGAHVILVMGPGAVPPPEGCEVVPVTTTDEMHRAVLERLRQATIVVAAAAVADYRPRQRASKKIKKTTESLALELESTVDILAEVGRLKGHRFIIGFAAETERAVEHGRAKLQAKNCDLMVANPVGDAAADSGFDSEDNQGWLISASGEAEELPRMSKRTMARRVFDRAVELRKTLEGLPR